MWPSTHLHSGRSAWPRRSLRERLRRSLRQRARPGLSGRRRSRAPHRAFYISEGLSMGCWRRANPPALWPRPHRPVTHAGTRRAGGRRRLTCLPACAQCRFWVSGRHLSKATMPRHRPQPCAGDAGGTPGLCGRRGASPGGETPRAPRPSLLTAASAPATPPDAGRSGRLSPSRGSLRCYAFHFETDRQNG